MKKINRILQGMLALGFSCLLTAAVLLATGPDAQSPVAVAAAGQSAPAAPGDVYCVAVISTTYPGCARVFTTVQAAVDAATGLETIKVAQGTYTAVNARPVPDGYVGVGGNITQVLYLTKTVFIQGGYTTTNWITPDPVAHPTTLDAQAQGRVVLVAGDIAPTLTGLRLMNGDATNLGGFDNSLFPPPDAYDVGGGVYIVSATATLSNSWVANNTASADLALPFSAGGGIYLNSSPAILFGNTVTTNTAQYGGGVYLYFSDAAVGYNLIQDNSTNDGGIGGGLYLDSSSAFVDHNTIISNSASAGNGGGVGLSGGGPALVNNVISGNSALDFFAGGGGLYLYATNATLVNNIIVDNEVGGLGAGIYIASASTNDLVQNTLARNIGGEGSGVYVEEGGGSTVYLANTILVSHTIGLFVGSGNSVGLDSTLFGGGTDTAGAGVDFNLNPHTGNAGFVNPNAGNYHITGSSAAVDQGIDAGVTTDIDDQERPIGLGFDIGADELYNPELAVVKSASSSSAFPGAVITYTIRLTNTGTVTLTSYISDTMPPSVTFKGPIIVNPAGGSVGTPPAVAGGQSVGIGKAITVTFPVTLNTGAGMTAGGVIANRAAITTSPTTLIAQPIVSTATVTILNAPPVAVNDTYTTSANSPITMSVRDNDSDANGDVFTITAIGTPLSGTASISGGAFVIYTPTTNFVGTDLFTYTVRDPGGLPGTASITVNVVNIPISGLAAQNSSPTTFGQPTLFTATIAAGTSVSYQWNFGDGNTSIGQTASHTYLAVGNYSAIVTATNSVPSSASASTAVTITKATPAVAITADVPDPSVVGQGVAITFTVTPPGAGTPTGVVTVTDGTQLCTATLPTTTCNIVFTSPGVKSLTAQYSGNSNFNSATSTSTPHTVNKASTTTSITAIVPSPALFGQSTAITTSLIVNAPGTGTPTGVITITDGTVSCTTTLPATACSLTFNVLGSHTLTATYSGDANFNGSSGTSPLTVNDIPVSGLAAQNSSPTRLDDATFFTATISTGSNVTYVWNFGDGNTATGALVAHTYAVSSTYTAIVTATNSFNSQSVSTPVSVTNQRPVAVALDNAYSPGTLVTLDGSASFDPDNHYPLIYRWTQTGGSAVSFTPNISVTTFTAPASPTVLTFTLTVTDSHNLPSVPKQVVITIADLPITGLVAQNSSPTALGLVTHFTATVASGSSVLYTWNFGDGVTTTGQLALHTYAATGNYTAIVTATNAANSATATTAVTITKATPAVAITSDVPDPSVVGQSVAITFTVTPPGSGTPTGVVTVTDGTQSCFATLPTTTCNIIFTSAGAKTLTAQYSGDGNFNGATSIGSAHTVNKASTTTSITAIVPSPALFGQSTAITTSLIVNAPGTGTPTGVITITDGTVSCIATLPATACSLTFNTLGLHTISATYSGDTNFNGSNATSPLIVNDVPISGLAAANSSPTRLGDATSLTATIAAGSNVIYTWNFGDGSATSTGANLLHTYALSGTYTAIVTATNSANSASATTAVTITNQRPVAVASNNAFQPASLATLDGSASFDPDNHLPLTYYWTQTGGAPMSFTPNLSITTFTAPGSATVLTFTLIVTDSRNLSSLPQQVIITIADLPITSLNATNSSPTVLGTATFFTGTQVGGTGVSYAWSFGDGGTGTGSNPNHTYGAIGTYTATVTATNVVNQLVATTNVIVGVPISGLAAANSSPTFVGSSTAFTATIVAGTNVAYQWAFGDSGTGSGANTAHAYGAPGNYTAVVTATNLFGSQVATTTVTVAAQAGLSLVKLDAPDPAAVGKPLVYTLVVRNSGPTNADNVVVNDTLATGLTFGSATTTQGTCGAPNVTCNIGTLINGGTVTVTIVVTPSMLITSPVIITNTASVSSSTTDPSLADNAATITTTIYPRRTFMPVIRR